MWCGYGAAHGVATAGMCEDGLAILNFRAGLNRHIAAS